MKPDRERWFNALRAEWFRALRPMGSWVPWELQEHVQLEDRDEEVSFWAHGLLREPPQLSREHLANCVVVPDRRALLVHVPHRAVVAEVGVSHGAFSRDILRVTDPKELHLIDHELQPAVVELAEERSARGIIHVHQGDSAETLETFEDAYFDWIYIDAQHGYEGVRRDIEVATRKVKADGLLVFNDYIMWSYVEMEPYGVVAAVNELCVDQGWEVLYLALPSHMYCDVAVRRRLEVRSEK